MKQEEKTKLTKEKILTAAIEEFGVHGYAATALNSILSRAGIAKGLFYHNFQDKDELYILCVRKAMNHLTDYLRSQDLDSDLEKYSKARLQFFRTQPNESRLFFEAVLQPPAALREKLEEEKREFDAFNLEFYGKILEELPLRQGVTKEDAAAYFSLMQNMFNAYFSSPACCEMPFSDKMAAHEAYLPRIFEYMLYGIAEKRD